MRHRRRVPAQPTDSLVVSDAGSATHAAAAINEDVSRRSKTLFCVSDGMGGLERGDLAAAAAVDALFQASPSDDRGLEAALFAANNAVRALAHVESVNLGATLTALLVRDGWWVAHAGDSRAWLMLDDGPLEQETVDDTAAVRLNITTEDERYEQMTGLLTVALGLQPVLDRPAISLPWPRRRARVALTTDGVHEYLSARVIEALSAKADAQTSAEALVDAAREAGSADDATAVIVEVLRAGRR